MSLSPEEVSLLSTIAPTLVAAGVAWVANKAVEIMRDRLHMHLDEADAKAVHDAADTAAGVILSQLSRGTMTTADVHAGHPAVIAAAASAREAVPDAADAMNVEVADMVRMVLGRLGHTYLPSAAEPPASTTVVKDIPHA